MKFLIIGLGSMGKRRIRNLLHLKISKNKIFGFDLSPERTKEISDLYGIHTFTDFKIADHQTNPDVYIISTPPHLHSKYFLHAAKEKKHFFVEVATTDEGYNKLYRLLDGSFVAAPSVTFRYYEPVRLLKKLVDKGVIGKILLFNHHLGQYLPDWHPWEDYRKFYVSQPKSSACREMVPYELQWIQYVVGDTFEKAVGRTSKRSDLELKIDDTYTAILTSKAGIMGTLIVDLVAQPAIRVFRLLGSKGTIEWNWQAREIRIWSVKTKSWKIIKLRPGKKLAEYKTTTEEMYEAELNDFLKAIRGKKQYPYTFAEDQNNFALLRKMEQAHT